MAKTVKEKTAQAPATPKSNRRKQSQESLTTKVSPKEKTKSDLQPRPESGWILGVDPGVQGGLALVCLATGKVITTAFPVMEQQGKKQPHMGLVRAWVLKNIGYEPVHMCAVEQVSARPDQGVVSMFTFGQRFGEILGALQWEAIDYRLISPKTWKAKLFAKEPKQEDPKKQAIDWAKKNFPDTEFPTKPRAKTLLDGPVEALCVAIYARDYLFA